MEKKIKLIILLMCMGVGLYSQSTPIASTTSGFLNFGGNMIKIDSIWLGFQPTPEPPAPPFTLSDTFGYVNGSTLAGQYYWKQEAGTILVAKPGLDGMVYASNASAMSAVYFDTIFATNYYSKVIADSVSSPQVLGPGVHLQGGSADGYGLYSGTTTSYLFRFNSGVPTLIGQGSPFSDGDEIKLACNGDTLFAYKNGYLDTSFDGLGYYIDDSPSKLSGGYAGLIGHNIGASSYADDWEAGEFTGSGLGVPIPVPPSTYDSLWYEIAHAQWTTTPESQVSGDVIVEIVPNRQWKKVANYNIILTSETSNFYVTDTTLYTYGSLSPGVYKVDYLLRDSIIWDTASIYVTVTPEASNVYIDFDWGGTELGTRLFPYNDFSLIGFSSNKNYYCKRGSSLTFSSYLSISQDNMVLGAYGTGYYPTIYTSYTGTGSGPASITIDGTSNTTIRDIKVVNTAANTYSYYSNPAVMDYVWWGGSFGVVQVKGGNTNLWIDNCILMGQDSAHLAYHPVRYEAGADIGGGIRNCQIAYGHQDGIFGTYMAGTSPTNMFHITDNYIYKIQWASYWNPSYVVPMSAGDCIDIHGYDLHSTTSYDSKYMYIARNLFSRTNTIYKHGMVYVYSPDSSMVRECESIVEYNRFEGFRGTDTRGQNGFSFYVCRGLVFRHNVSYSGTRGLYSPNETEYQTDPATNDMEIYDNLIINPKWQGIRLNHSTDGTKIYNNTIIMTEVDNFTSDQTAIYTYVNGDNIELRNNIIYLDDPDIVSAIIDNSGTLDEDWNLFNNTYGWSEGANSIVDDPDFVSGFSSDYEIPITSPAYQAGTDVGLTTDSWNTTWLDPPSMGYKEYVPPIDNAEGHPITHDQTFLAHQSMVNGDYLGYFHYLCTDSIFNDHTGGTYTWAILSGNTDSDGDAVNPFTIDGNGLITVQDVDDINLFAGNYTLSIEVGYGSDKDTANAYIYYNGAAKFIDPSKTTDGAMTRANPGQPSQIGTIGDINGGDMVVFQRGKSGTPSQMQIATTGGDWLYIGAYGTGAKPRFGRNTSSSYFRTFQFGSFSAEDGVEGANMDADSIYICDLEFYGRGDTYRTHNAFRVEEWADEIHFNRCEFDGLRDDDGAHAWAYFIIDGDAYMHDFNSSIQDCEFRNRVNVSPYPGRPIKLEGGGIRLSNDWVLNDAAYGAAIDIGHGGYNYPDPIEYIYVAGNDNTLASAFQMRQQGIVVNYSVVKDMGYAYDFEDADFYPSGGPIPYAWNDTIRNFIALSNHQLCRFEIIDPGNSDDYFRGILFENGFADGNDRGFDIDVDSNPGTITGVTIQKTIVVNSGDYDLYVDHTEVDTINVYNNIFYGSVSTNVQTTGTLSNGSFINNIYQSIANTGHWTGSPGFVTNYDYDLGDPFNDKATGDYTTKSGTSSVIDNGTDLGFLRDIINNQIGVQDIGPFEYGGTRFNWTDRTSDYLVFWSENFNDWSIDSIITEAEFQAYWPTADIQSDNDNIAEEVAIRSFDGSNVFSSFYPQDECCYETLAGTDGTGIHLEVPLSLDEEKVILSYNIYFQSDWTMKSNAGIKSLGLRTNSANPFGRTMIVNSSSLGRLRYPQTYYQDVPHLGTTQFQNPTDTITRGTWHHVDIVYDIGTINTYDGSMAVYIDGELISSGAATGLEWKTTSYNYNWNILSFETFMGGSDLGTYASPQDQSVAIDDIVLWYPTDDVTFSFMEQWPSEANWPR